MKYLLPGIMLLASVIAASPLQADTADEVKVVSLAVHPAAEPTPALRYRLLPDHIDQEPGNAAQLYYLAANLSERVEAKYKEHINDWLETPLESLPTEAVAEMLNWHEAALRYLDLAGQRERCHWDIAARSEGYKTLLPPLSEFRSLAKVLAVRCRLEIAEGRLDEAVKTLQTSRFA